jgi:hypothetical protein
MMFHRSLSVFVVVLPLLASPTPKDAVQQPTFYKDVLPILQNRCQQCHRAGEAAPMALMTYEQVRPWAKAIREAVLKRLMPPWFADPAIGKFANDHSLKAEELETLVSWVDQGAKAGNPQEAPPQRQFVEGWNIGQPDVVFEMPREHPVPASGTIEYTYFVLPTGFQEDKWVRMAEVRPGNRQVVHHVIAFIREPGSKWLKEAKYGEPYIPPPGTGDRGQGENLVGYAPGMPPRILRENEAILIKAGSDIVFQMHYTANGKATTDKTRIGLVFAKQPPQQRVTTLAASNMRFVIPPGVDNYKVSGRLQLQADATLRFLMPHMHLRGKAFAFRAIYPDGRVEELLRVPRYDFNWQLAYELAEPKPLPKGTIIEADGYFDNSPNNPNNPDPKAEVRFGEQSWEEMMFGFFEVAFDPKLTPRDLLMPKKAQSSGD